MKTHTIELTTGYEEKQKDGTVVLHREVTFGKRLTVKDLIVLDNDPRAANPIKNYDRVMLKAMTKFGTMKSLPAADVLLGLDSIDREDLDLGFNEFLAMTREDPEVRFPDNTHVNLCFGFSIDDVVYKNVEVGKLNTGQDELDASALGLGGVLRGSFLLGRRITKLTAENGATFDGPLDAASFANLDAQDFKWLEACGKMAATFLRIERSRAAQKRTAESGGAAIEGAEDPGDGNTGVAANEDRESPEDSRGAKQA